MNYLIYGSSYRLIDAEKNKILKDKNYDVYFLSEISFQDFINDINYSSLFDEEKNIVIKNFELLFQSKKDNASTLKALSEYLSNPNPNINIIFISNEKINDKSKQNKEILSKLKIVETPIFTKNYELAKYLMTKFMSMGYGITQNAVNLLVEKCNLNYDIAMNEFENLIKIKNSKILNENDIEELVNNYNLNDVFGFKDAFISKNYKKALQILDELESSKYEIISLIIMLGKEYIELINIKTLSDKGYSNDKIGEMLNGMHPYRVRLLRENANKYTIEQLKKIIVMFADLNIKYISEDNLGYEELKKILYSI